MRVIVKPTLITKDVYEICISRVRNKNLRENLHSISDNIEAASMEYQQKSADKHWYTIEASTQVGIIGKDELEKVYTQRMAKQGSPGRPIYDQIKNSTPNGVCPLCGQHTVSTLDHFLPKADFPTLVVSPQNLVPACHDCNKAKLDKVPTNAIEQILHPYYDDVTHEQWLFAEVIDSTPAFIRFFTSHVDAYDDELNHRINFHFSTLNLAQLYMSNANSTVTEIQFRLSKLHQKGGKLAVKDHLIEEEESRRNNYVNSWNTAAYQAMMNSDWFCDGGFNEFRRS